MAKRESFLQSIGSAVIWKTSERVTGLIKHVVVAAVIGLSAQLDVFYMAIAILGLLIFSWAKLIDVMAVPQMVKLNQEDNKQAFQSISSSLFTLCVLFSLFLSLCILFLNDYIAKIAIGFDPARQALLANALLWLLPVSLVFIPFRFIGSVFRTTRRFSIFYQAEFVVGLVAVLLIIGFKTSNAVLLWSYSIGVICAFTYLYLSVRRQFKFWGNPFSKEVLQILHMAPGLLLLQGSEYLFVLSDRVFISFLSSGSVGALAYGRMLAYVLAGLISFRGSFITVFAERSDSSEKKQSLYNDIISLSVFLAIPVSVFLLVFGQDIITFFLQRGAFSKGDTELVYKALAGYVWALLPVLAIGPIEQVFQVQGRIDLLVHRRIAGLVLNASLNALFLFVFNWGVSGIAWATSISHWFIFIWALYSAGETGLQLKWGRSALWLLWVMAFSIVGAVCLKFSEKLIEIPFIIVIQSCLYALIVITGTVIYKGREGALARQTLKRISSFKRKQQ